jgi:hypothetical protein
VWSGFTWLKIGIVGGLLWVRWWTFWFWRHWVSTILNTHYHNLDILFQVSRAPHYLSGVTEETVYSHRFFSAY